MVHCISSSEPDSGGDVQLTSEEWRGKVQVINNNGNTKEVSLSQPPNCQTPQPQLQPTTQQQPQQQPVKPIFVESSTVSSGIQVGSFIEQTDAEATCRLTLIDTHIEHQFHHELADTTQLENTHEPMDTTTTSSPNHSIHSDTIVIAERITEELTCGDDYFINKDVVREVTLEQLSEPSYHFHQQQQPMLIDNTSDDNSVSNICEDQQPPQEEQSAAVTALVQHESQKIYSVGIAPSLYPHLYNFRPEQDEQLTVVNYQASEKLQLQQQAFYNPYVYNNVGLTNYIENAVELEDETAESSDEEDEEL